ncbi:lysozyme inhibitor LprI family protein [Pseudomonas frederiksbergensis]|uniref:lysozyme inhibitor LprI family protein n=1 Tax=Pseudomonas frederiksbergensis TaxID=104087 RepID=UPI003D22372B
MYTKGRCILSACALLATPHALATGMDCTKAASTVEKTICANPALYELDTQMGSVYRGVIDANPQVKSNLKTAQRLWLKTRDQCAENVDCLDQRYRERLQILLEQRNEAAANQPAGSVKLMLDDVRQAILTASKTDAEFPLERALHTLAIKTGTTSFSNEADNGNAFEEAHFPKKMPEGVTQDEWRALTTSKVAGAGENGNTSYMLIDLDGDGLRDLVVDTYAGGTGLFSFIETFRRTGDVFVRRVSTGDAESSLFSLNDRGANQSVNWINIRGQVYAAYRNSYYGIDQVYFLDPFKVPGSVPIVAVNYRYQLWVPKIQKNEASGSSIRLDGALHKALTQALGKVSKIEAKDVGDQSSPLCPIPSTGEGDGAYYSYGTGHYTFEIVGDMSVVIGEQCYIGRLMDWFGGYSEKNGLYAELHLRKPDFEGDERSYQVNGRRRMTDVTTSVGQFEGDNGG